MKNTEKNIDKLWIEYKIEISEKKKEELTNRLVLHYYDFVKKIAYKLSEKLGWKVHPEELTSYGIDGLYIAIDKFDLTKGIKFEWYAGTRIRGSMLDGIRKEDVIPRSVRINHNIYEQARQEIENENRRSASEIEILEKSGLQKEDYYKNKKKYIPVIYTSLQGTNMPQNNNEDTFKQDFNIHFIDHKEDSPDNKIHKKEFFNKLLGKGFTPIERKIIYSYYWQGLTMQDIAKETKQSESRISQIHKKALPKLKKKIEKNPRYFGHHAKEFINEKIN